MKLKFLIGLTVVYLTAFSAQAQKIQPKIDEKESELRRATFSKVWQTVNDKHYDKTFGGTDWAKVREIYEPKALAAETRTDFYVVLRQMLGELKLSHFNIMPENSPDNKGEFLGGTIGVELKMIDGKPVVSRVEKDSPAEKAGLQSGFIIEKINDKPVAEMLAPLEKFFSGLNFNEATKTIYRQANLRAAIGGKTETTVKIEALDGVDKPQTFEIKRISVKREMSEAFGNFPAQEVIFESERLDGNIGYISFNLWIIPQMAKIRAAMKEFADTKGIIFDLRGNPGGIGGMASGIAGLLTDKQFSLGSVSGRESKMNFIVYPQSEPFMRKVVVLTDGGSGSTSEIFVAGLQDAGRAQIIGEKSAGAVLPSVFEILPTGATFQYAFSDYKSPKNVLIEGVGVKPDLEVKITRQSLLEKRDLQLEEAVKQILK